MGYHSRAAMNSILLLFCALATTCSDAIETPEAQLEGVRCREVRLPAGDGESVLIVIVCQIGDSADPITPGPPPTPSLSIQPSGSTIFPSVKSPSLLDPRLTAQPSEAQQPRPHTP
jgi:hypothetical protein